MRQYKKLSLIGAVEQSSPRPIVKISEKQMEMLKGYSQALLAIIAIAGVISIAAVMPGALAAFKLFCKLRRTKINDYSERNLKITKTFCYLKRRGLIDIIRKNKCFKVRLTKKGLTEYRKLEFRALSIPRDDRWDNKFWQVAADIPTKHRRGADAFRKKIKILGLFALQRTLWFYPYDPRREIELISRFYDILPFVTVMKIEMFDPADYRVIKKYFRDNSII